MNGVLLDARAHVGPWRQLDSPPPAVTADEALRLYRLLRCEGVLLAGTDAASNAELAAFVHGWRGRPAARLAWWIDPRDEDALGALQVAMEHVALVHLQPALVQTPLTDPRWRAFVQLAADAGRPVRIDCGPGDPLMACGGAFDLIASHADVPFLLACQGGHAPELVLAVLNQLAERDLPNVYLGTEGLREHWLIRAAVDRLGPGRVVFGSAYPFTHPEVVRTAVDHAGLSSVERYLVFGGTLNRLLPPTLRFEAEGEPPGEGSTLPATLEASDAPATPPLEIRLLDLLDQGLVVYDHEHRIRFWNRRMEDVSGVHRDAVLGRDAFEEFPFLVDKGVDALLQAAFRGQVIESGTVRFSIPRTGRTGYRRSRLVPLLGAEGHVHRVVEVVTFVAEGDELPLAQGDGVASMALLADGLATRLSNQLGVVLGYAQALVADLRGDPATARALGVIEDATRKAFDLTKTLFSLARFQDASKGHLRLDDVVTYTVDTFRLRQAMGACIDVSCAEELPPVHGNEGQLREALLQVLKNAHEAIEGRPEARIEVRLDRVELPRGLDNGERVLPEGRFVRVSVRDTGPGIPDEIRESVRLPFFTTKGRQRLGLGLNVVENALRACGGISHIRSEPGRGTTVDLYFPCEV